MSASATLTGLTFPSAPNPLPGGDPLDPFVAEVVPPSAFHLPTAQVRVRMRELVTPHPALPPVPAWGFGRPGGPVTSPGPLLEARQGVTSRVRWDNDLASQELPYDLVVMPDRRRRRPGPEPPRHRGAGHDAAHRCAARLARDPHLHGGHTEPESDGWPDHMIQPGENQRCRYANDDDNADLGLGKVGPALWYHDHAMDATRLHVYAGLSGGHVVRHPSEAMLGLPTSAAQGEAVLFLQDRNVTVGRGRPRSGCCTRRPPTPRSSSGRSTLVNGKVWPRMEVGGSVVRLRLYNGSNARFYRLHLLDDAGALAHGRVLVIGTDGGLLWKAHALSDGEAITLAPAERVDLLVDLRGLQGRHLYVVNSAQAAFSGDAPPDRTRRSWSSRSPRRGCPTRR